MSNSPLVDYTKISPNRTIGRNHVIDRITPHCVVGQLSVETIGHIFEPESRQASCNYGIGQDGRVGMYCEEKDRSWCTSSGANDHRAITIECASDLTHPYAFKDIVYSKLIELCADICKRNGKTKLLWFEDKDKSLSYEPKSNEMILTVHRWFANKSCPGDWMYARMGELATTVTSKLNPQANPDTEEYEEVLYYRVQTGAFRNKSNAEKQLKAVKEAGFSDAFITTALVKEAKVSKASTPVETPKVIEVGSKVKIRDGAKDYYGNKMAFFVYEKEYTVDSLSGNRAVIDKNGINSAFNVKDLILVI